MFNLKTVFGKHIYQSIVGQIWETLKISRANIINGGHFSFFILVRSWDWDGTTSPIFSMLELIWTRKIELNLSLSSEYTVFENKLIRLSFSQTFQRQIFCKKKLKHLKFILIQSEWIVFQNCDPASKWSKFTSLP